MTSPELNLKPRWIMSVKDLSDTRGKKNFKLKWQDGDTRFVTLDNRLQEILEALQAGPVFCASPVRLSDAIFRLGNSVGRLVHKRETTKEGRNFYRLDCIAEVICESEVAA